MRNETVLNNLPGAPRTKWIPSYLLSESGEVLFEFLYNCETLEHSYDIRHVEAETALSSVQNQHYGSTTGKVLRLNDLLMESWGSQKSLRPLLEKLRSLSIADPTNGVYAPPTIYFAWGSYISPPSVLTEGISWTETAWLGGEPAEVRLNLTLKEVPPSTATQPAAPGIPEDSILPTNEEQEAAERLDSAIRIVTNSIASLAETVVNPNIDRNDSRLVSTAKALTTGKAKQIQRQRVTIKAGDSLYKLAKKHLGARNRWRELALYNGIQPLDALQVGRQLTIPTQDEVKQIAAAILQSAPDPIANVITPNLDLSSVKQPGTGEYSLVSWLL